MHELIDEKKNQWTGIYEPESIVDELIYDPAENPLGIQLVQKPQLNSPSTTTAQIIDKLNGAIDDSQTTLSLINLTWHTNGDIIQVDSEKIALVNCSSNPVTVTRGYGGTTPAAHADQAIVRKLNSMVEVAVVPAAGQFQINYETGHVRFSSTDALKTIYVTYQGLGTIACKKYLSGPGQYLGTGEDGPLYVAAGTTFEVEGVKNYTDGVIEGTVKYPANWTKVMELRFTGTLRVKNGGKIDVSGQGAAGGTSGGAGTHGTWGGAGGCGGGSAAGAGGDALTTDRLDLLIASGFASYLAGGGVHSGTRNGADSYIGTLATEALRAIIGGGGGAGKNVTSNGGSGGKGGAMAVIKARVIIVDFGGAILAKGENGVDHSTNGGGGGAGGGALLLFLQLLVNNGTISVDGGIGGLCLTIPGANGGKGILRILQI